MQTPKEITYGQNKQSRAQSMGELRELVMDREAWRAAHGDLDKETFLPSGDKKENVTAEMAFDFDVH